MHSAAMAALYVIIAPVTPPTNLLFIVFGIMALFAPKDAQFSILRIAVVLAAILHVVALGIMAELEA